jgi:hypothetical protein
MATRKYSADIGCTKETVTDGVGSATTTGIECTFDLAKVDTREHAVLALEAITEYILNGIWPPA